jgi:hypothetical protein
MQILGRGAMVARRTLDPFILVRIRAPQPECLLLRIIFVLDEVPTAYSKDHSIGRVLLCVSNAALAVFLFPRVKNKND